MPTIPPATEELPSSSVPCPSCGVPVAIGYPRCPKCKAAVPQAPRMRRGSVREQLLAGGTSSAPEETTGGGGSWLPWVLAALAVVGIGAFLAFRDGGSKATPTDTGKVTDDEGDDEDDDTEGTNTGEVDDETPKRVVQPVDEPVEDTMGAAAASLDEALRGARLWAKVTRDDDELLIESSLCPQIEEQIEALAREAHALGANRVQCHAEHGQVMFERAL